MDYPNSTPNVMGNTPQPSSHKKIRWILAFVVCLIILVALVSLIKKENPNQAPDGTDTAASIKERMTATGPSVVTQEEMKVLEQSMTAKTNKSIVTAQQQADLEKMMSANPQ